MRAREGDFLVVAFVVACSLAVGWPILAGGAGTFLDNAPHLAEVYDLARLDGDGWSELAFCGYPITGFHSPLWYGLLARLHAAGLPVVPIYGALCIAGFAALPLAVALVARRELGPGAALWLAAPLLTRSEVIETHQTPLGGMWPFGLATAALVLLVVELGTAPADGPGWGHRLRVAALVAFACLTHGFALVLLPWVLAVHVGLAARRSSARRVALDLAAVVAGLATAAVLWWPALLSRDWMVLDFQRNRSVEQVARNLADWQLVRLGALKAIPQLALLGLALAGSVLAVRAGGVARSAAGLALALLLILFFWLPGTGRATLGTDSARVLHFVRGLLALAAMPALGWLQSRAGAPRRHGATIVVVAGTFVVCFAWGTRVARHVAPIDGRDMVEVRVLWDWLCAHPETRRGRVYLQDTFGLPDWPELDWSHPLALTAHEAGVRQLGAFYAGFPPPVERWTRAEHGEVLGRQLGPASDATEVARLFDAARVSHVVIAEPRLRGWFQGRPGFAERWRSQRFTVYERPPAARGPVEAGPGVSVRDLSRAAGRLAFEVTVTAGQAAVTLGTGEAFHPFWRVDGPPGVAVAPDADGLLTVIGVPSGTHRLVLRYAPPTGPRWLSALGGLALVGLAAAAARTRTAARSAEAGREPGPPAGQEETCSS